MAVACLLIERIRAAQTMHVMTEHYNSFLQSSSQAGSPM